MTELNPETQVQGYRVFAGYLTSVARFMKNVISFEQGMKKFCIEWQFVGNETQIYSMPLKMLYIPLLPKYTK
jgi:hypothetical protein